MVRQELRKFKEWFFLWYNAHCVVCGGHSLQPFWALELSHLESPGYNPGGQAVWCHGGSCRRKFFRSLGGPLAEGE